MAKIQFKGPDEYALKLSRLAGRTQQVADKAIYEAAGIVADAIKAELNGLPTVPESYNVMAHRSGTKSGLTKRQKQGLINSFGVTKISMDQKGFYNRKIGFDGYNQVVTKAYPKGQPNQLIARVVESGSSYMDKMPFVRPAVRRTQNAAIERMRQVIDEEIGNIMD